MPTLIHKDSTLEILEELKLKRPQAAIHDGLHYLFADTPEVEGATQMGMLVYDTDDELAWMLSKLLVEPEIVVQGSYQQFQTLHEHPAWRLWCANYDSEDQGGREQFKADWLYVEQLIADAMPEAASTWPAYNEDMTYEQGREIIYAAVTTTA